MSKNPFKADMLQMKAPEGCGPNISVGGFTVEVDSSGVIEVPPQYEEQLIAHGFSRVKPVPEIGRKK